MNNGNIQESERERISDEHAGSEQDVTEPSRNDGEDADGVREARRGESPSQDRDSEGKRTPLNNNRRIVFIPTWMRVLVTIHTMTLPSTIMNIGFSADTSSSYIGIVLSALEQRKLIRKVTTNRVITIKITEQGKGLVDALITAEIPLV